MTGPLRTALDRDPKLLRNPTQAELEANLAALFAHAQDSANAYTAERLSALHEIARDALTLGAGSSLEAMSLSGHGDKKRKLGPGLMERSVAFLVGLLLVLAALIVFPDSLLLAVLLIAVAVLNGVVAGRGGDGAVMAGKFGGASGKDGFTPPSAAKFTGFIDALDRLLLLSGERTGAQVGAARGGFDNAKVLRLIQFMLAQSEKDAGPQAHLIKEIAQDAAEEAGYEVLWRLPPPGEDKAGGRPLFVASIVDDLQEDIVSLPALRRPDDPHDVLQGQVFKGRRR